MDLIGAGKIADFLSNAIDKIFPDKEAALKAKVALAEAERAGQLAELQLQWDNAKAQLEVNKTEAAHPAIFVAGWRPYIGWVCGASLTYQFVLRPFLQFIVELNGSTVIPPSLDLGDLITILLGMLGMGAMRSAEKFKGVARKR